MSLEKNSLESVSEVEKRANFWYFCFVARVGHRDWYHWKSFFFFFFFSKKDMCLPLSQFPFDQVCQFTVHSWLFCANQLKTSFQLNWNRVVISSDPICLNLSFTLLPLLCGISNIQLFCFEKLIKEKYYSLWRPCKIYKERPFSNHLLDNWIIFFPLKLKILGTNLQLAKTWSC